MREIIKKRCYIMTNVFDDEIDSLISACKIDCVQSGVSESVFETKDNKYDDQVVNCVVAFVKAHRGNDRSDSDIYLKMYESYRNKMTLESAYNSSEQMGDNDE